MNENLLKKTSSLQDVTHFATHQIYRKASSFNFYIIHLQGGTKKSNVIIMSSWLLKKISSHPNHNNRPFGFTNSGQVYNV